MGLQTASDREGMTRSQLLAARRAESAEQLQSSYDVWANRNPMWAPRATGPEAAAALGYVSSGESAGPSTRRELMLERQMDNLRQSVAASGFGKDTQAALCANEPGVLVTSIVREAGQQNPSTAWVDKPKRATRTDLAKARAEVDRGTIQHYQDRYEKYGHMDAQARSDFRVDQTIARMLDAGGGDTRSQLMERRKQQRMDDVEIAAEKVGFMPVPQFAEQEKPFWRVGRPQTADAASPRGSKSREQMMSDRRWYAKPEHYPRVNPAEPRGDDDFKLAPDDKRYLHRKLANGPRKHQRGYPGKGGADGHPTASPVEDSALAEKLTIAPAPPIPVPEVPKHGNRAASAAPGGRRPVHPRFSDTVFRFLPPEERADHGQVCDEAHLPSSSPRAPLPPPLCRMGTTHGLRTPMPIAAQSRVSARHPRARRGPSRTATNSRSRSTRPSPSRASSRAAHLSRSRGPRVTVQASGAPPPWPAAWAVGR